jgi:hypothetical protein
MEPPPDPPPGATFHHGRKQGEERVGRRSLLTRTHERFKNGIEPRHAMEADTQTYANPILSYREDTTEMMYTEGSLTQLDAGDRRRREGRGQSGPDLEGAKGTRRGERGGLEIGHALT